MSVYDCSTYFCNAGKFSPLLPISKQGLKQEISSWWCEFYSNLENFLLEVFFNIVLSFLFKFISTSRTFHSTRFFSFFTNLLIRHKPHSNYYFDLCFYRLTIPFFTLDQLLLYFFLTRSWLLLLYQRCFIIQSSTLSSTSQNRSHYFTRSQH